MHKQETVNFPLKVTSGLSLVPRQVAWDPKQIRQISRLNTERRETVIFADNFTELVISMKVCFLNLLQTRAARCVVAC